MNQSTMEAYTEVYEILRLMDRCYVVQIPQELVKAFREKRAKDYNKEIDINKPLEEQNLKEETLSILAVLNYNYWTKTEKHKSSLMNLYTKNEKKHQEVLRKKYNPDNIFNNNINRSIVENENIQKVESIEEVEKENNTNIEEYKESFFKKIINWFKSIFK